MTELLWLLILPGLLIAGAVYQTVGSWIDKRRFPPPGRVVDIGSCKLHLKRQGSGQPVVVLEADIAATSIGWSPVQTRLADFTTVCSYDRAGLGWSERRRDRSCPCTLERMIGELEMLLRKSGLAAPFLLVGHSFGGLLVQAFAHSYPEQVAGLVLVDPVSVSYWGNASQADMYRIHGGAGFRGAALCSRASVWCAQR